MLTSPSEAIDLLGGAKPVSEQLGRAYPTVASWSARQSIPVEEWESIIAMASGLGVEGITYETLARAHAQHPRGSSRKRAEEAAA